MDLIDGGKLSKLISDRTKKGKCSRMTPLIGKYFSMQECSSIIRHVLKAVTYIHDKGIVHRDIKPENIMLENENDLTSIKLIDFGLSVKYNDHSFTNMLNDRCGTVIFMAPEILLFKDYNKSVDVWSIGILMYMLISGGIHPFYKHGMSLSDYREVLKTYPQVKYDTDKFSKLAISLIDRFL